MANKFMHVGISVTDIDKIMDFYIKYFGFRKSFGTRFDEDFIGSQPALYRQPDGVWADMQMIKSEDGIVIELFRYSNVEHVDTAEWQKTGYNHISIKVPDLPVLYERMRADGIEFLLAPMKVDGAGHKAFLKDPDGNMMELWD
jgi:catechol 2,3-dioxygenase-like lactoylglutathione lyase family enzyme